MKTIEAMQQVYEGKGKVCAVASEKWYDTREGEDPFIESAAAIVYDGVNTPMPVQAKSPNAASLCKSKHEDEWRIVETPGKAVPAVVKGFWGRNGVAPDAFILTERLADCVRVLNTAGYWGPIKVTLTVEPCTDYFEASAHE